MAAIAALVEQGTSIRMNKKIINSFVIRGALIYGTRFIMNLVEINLEHMQSV